MLTTIKDAISGKKTYALGALIVAIGVAEGLFNVDLPGVEVDEDWVAWIIAGLTTITMRRGVEKQT